MTAAPPPARPRRAARIAVAAAFLVAFLWQVLGAVSNLQAWSQFSVLLGRQLSAFAWVVLLIGLVIPIATYAGGLVVGRRRSPGPLALVLLVALAVSQALTLSQLAFFLAGIGAL